MPRRTLYYDEKLGNAYTRIYKNAKPQLDHSGFVECLVLHHTGEIVKNKHADTFKVSFGKDKRLAHRVAYEAFHGPPDDDMDVSHLCHNESCVKIEHYTKSLIPITWQESAAQDGYSLQSTPIS